MQHSLLDDYLQDKPTLLQNRVLQLAVKLKIPPDDPFWVILVVTGYIESLLDEKPKQVDELFEDWEAKLRAILDIEFQRAIEKYDKEVKVEAIKAAKEALKKVKMEQQQATWWNYFQGGGVLFAAIGVGVVLGMAVPVWLEGGLTGSRSLTAYQSETLRWATSPEGKLARQVMDWNRDTLANKSCLEDAKKSSVSVLVGQRKATRGYCLIWVVPLGQR